MFMKKKYNITVNGEKYEVEVELIDSEDGPASAVSHDSFSIPAAVPASPASASRPDVSDNDIPVSPYIYKFCGFPTGVSILPKFAAIVCKTTT